jgi:hypothetical protein
MRRPHKASRMKKGTPMTDNPDEPQSKRTRTPSRDLPPLFAAFDYTDILPHAPGERIVRYVPLTSRKVWAFNLNRPGRRSMLKSTEKL